MRFPRTIVKGLARAGLGTLAGFALIVTAAPVQAGQVNLEAITSLATVTQTVLQTTADTIADTLAGTSTGTLLETSVSTLTATAGSGATVLHSLDSTITDTTANTLARTTTGTSLATITSTVLSTTVETVTFVGQPADVSVEISQAGLNYTSPFSNELVSGALNNTVTVTATSGLTQVGANAGNANVSVASSSIIDGGSLAAALGTGSTVANMQVAALTLVPGFAVQNSNALSLSQIASQALAAAAETFTGTTDTTGSTISGSDSTTTTESAASVVSAVDIVQSDVNEYSPHNNSTLVSGDVNNSVTVVATSGITQVQANAGSANSASTHSVIIYESDIGTNGSAGFVFTPN